MQVEWGLSLTKAGREDSQNQAEAKDQSLAVLGQSQVIVSSELRLAQAQAQVVPHYRGSDARGWWGFPGVLQKVVDGKFKHSGRCAVPVHVPVSIPVAG
jgi:hypothetical protein